MTNLLITLVLILAIVVMAKVVRVFKLSSELREADPSVVPKAHPNLDDVKHHHA